jgi:DNA-binding NtrC family response regulator
MAEPAISDQRREARILVVEDNDALRRGICIALGEHWSVVDEESHGEAAVARLRDRRRPPYQVIVTDIRLPGADGLQVLRAARERDEDTSVIVMTAYGSIDTAVEAMRLGAFDFLQKPFDLAHLELRVARASESAAGSEGEGGELETSGPAMRDVVVESDAMREAVDLVKRVADTRSTVLITGETGTGKEIIAGLVHSLSLRASQSFVKVNCAAVPETLLESELFGHERGAFTGADRQRVGRFEQANGGTLFMDEIGDMTLATQAKLLRVLQDQEFYRLGGTRALRTDARIVAATNHDLAEAKERGAFREDLYFRLDVIGIHLKPLRERPEDLRVLCERFLNECAEELDRPVLSLSEAAWSRLLAYRWPGNIRELSNAIERAVLTCGGEQIEASDLDLSEAAGAVGAPGWRPEIPDAGISLRDVERELVVAALERTGFVQKDAAVLLDVSRRKLNYMIQRMGITHPSWRRNRDTGSGS